VVQSSASNLSNAPLSIKWQEGSPAPVSRAFHTAVLHDGKVYIGGGDENGYFPSYRIDVYTDAKNSWSASPIYTSYCYFAMTTLNNKLITVGGKDRGYKVTNIMFLLDGDQLNEYTVMTSPRYYTTAAGHQETLIIVGGYDEKERMLASTDLFNSVTGQWYYTDDLPLPHYRLQASIINNTLYLLGGYNQSDSASLAVFTAPLDSLSTHKLKWSSHQHTPCYCSASFITQHGHLLTVGGSKRIGICYLRTSDIHAFNKANQSWEVVGQIPSERSGSAAVSIADNRCFVVGGWDDKGQNLVVHIGSYEPQ